MVHQELTSILAQPQEGIDSEQLITLATEAGFSPDQAQRAIALSNKPKVNVLSDQPVSEDAFGFDAIVRVLADVITSESTQTPITIAIDGEWGTGKTSILRMIEAQARMLRFPCLWLNAWSLDSTQSLIVAAASEIQRELGRSQQDSRKDLVARLLKLINQAAAASVSMVMPLAARDLADTLQDLSQVGVERQKDILELASVATTRKTFEELVTVVLKRSSRENTRLIVFIDDIDRALPDQIATILKNLKLILEIPNCVFVIGMDMQLVARSIEEYYRRQSSQPSYLSLGQIDSSTVHITQTGGALIGEGFGDNYLEKLVQMRIVVPTLTRAAVGAYLRSIGIAPEVQEILRWAPDGDILNPRRLKRYINWLSFSLEMIMSARFLHHPLSKAIPNITALRAMALQRDYPEIYQSLIAGSAPDLDAFLAKRSSIEQSDERMADFRKYLGTLSKEKLRVFNDFARTTRLLGVEYIEPKTGLPRSDPFGPYELGMQRLLELLGNKHDRYGEALTLEQRLHENIARTRQYGDTETSRFERMSIIQKLNELVRAVASYSFNELCSL